MTWHATTAACRPYRPKTKGKVERPFRYVREDFFLARSFHDLDDLNGQLRHWLDTVANARRHATTKRIVAEAFADERPHLRPLPLVPYEAVLRVERRVSHEGFVAYAGNLYSVPDTTRRRTLEVHVLADRIRIYEAGALVACHVPLEGRGLSRVDPTHRRARSGAAPRRRPEEPVVLRRAGEQVARRPLAFYDAVGRQLARTTDRGGRA